MYSTAMNCTHHSSLLVNKKKQQSCMPTLPCSVDITKYTPEATDPEAKYTPEAVQG